MLPQSATHRRDLPALFMRETEITPHELIEPAPLDAACTLLAGSDCPLHEVWYDFGFVTGIDSSNRLGGTPARYPARSHQSKAVTERTGIVDAPHDEVALTGESAARHGPKWRVPDQIWRPLGLCTRTQLLYRLRNWDEEGLLGAKAPSGTVFPKEGRFERAGA